MSSPIGPPEDPIPEPFEIDLLQHQEAIQQLIETCPLIVELLNEFLENYGDQVDQDLWDFLVNVTTIFDTMVERNVTLSDKTKIIALKAQLRLAQEHIELFQVGRPTKPGIPDEDVPE